MVYRYELIKEPRTRALRSDEWPRSKQKVCPYCNNAIITKYNRLAIPVTLLVLITLRHIYPEASLNFPALFLITAGVIFYVEKSSRFLRDE